MKKIYVLLFIILGVHLSSFGQDDLDEYLNNYPTEPEVSSFNAYGNYSPPNAFGVIPVSIPLYRVSVNELNLPIYLNYNAGSGLRVNQRSSAIGLGWSLNVNNCYIETTINGQIDWQPHNAESIYNDIETRKNSTDIHVVGGIYNELKNSILGNNGVSTDFELDDYSYNFNGHSGHFIFDEAGDIVNLSSSNSDLKIVKNSSNGFTITDTNGDVYLFDIKIDFTTEGIEVVKRRWYLQKIVFLTGEEIQFVYTDGSSETGNIVYEGETSHTSRDQFIIYETYTPTNAYYLRPDVSTAPSFSTITNKLNLLKTIIFPNGKIEFGNTQNSKGKLLISDIELFSKKGSSYDKIKTVRLQNENFHLGKNDGSTTPVDISPKLELVSYHDKNNKEVESYQFYYDAELIPQRNSVHKDYWGYYAGTNSGGIPEFTYYKDTQAITISGGNREPDQSYTQAGILNKIVYPTGGSSEFIYEPNYYSIETVTNSGNTVNKNISLTAIGQNPTVGDPKPEDIYEFDLQYGQVNSPGGITVTYSASRFTQQSTQVPYFEIYSPNNLYSEVFHIPTERNSGTFYITNLPTGHYYAKAYVGDATLDPNDPEPPIFGTADVELTLNWSQYEDTGSTTEEILLTGGGLRIKEIKSYTDSNSSVPDLIKTFEYGSETVNNKGVGDFMGVHTQKDLVGSVNANIRDEDHLKAHFLTKKDYDLVHGTLDLMLHCNQDHYTGETLQLSTDPQFPIEFNGSSVYYNKVNVSNIDGNSQSLGNTEYCYSLPKPKKISSLVGNFSNSSSVEKDLSAYSSYTGINLIREVIFNNAGDTIKEKDYNYETYSLKNMQKLKLALSDYTYNISGCYISSADFERTFIDHNLRYYKYYESLEVDKLTSITEKNYFNGEILSTNTSNSYISDYSFRISETSTINSEGKTLTTKNYYPDNVISTTSLPGRTLTTPQFYAIDSLKSVRSDGLDGQHRIAKPVQTETYKEGQLLERSRVNYKDWGYDPTYTGKIIEQESIEKSKGNGELQSKINFHKYNGYGDPLDISKADGTHIVYVWGYDHSKIIAKIKNASYEQVLIYFDLASGPPEESPTVSEKDLRDYFQTMRGVFTFAKITSYTYDPLIGLTSITDPSGYTSYYVYDDFNRLKYIKNKDGDVLEQYRYNYALEELSIGNITAPTSVNVGDNIAITSTINGGSGNFIYQWTVPGVTSLPNSNQISFTALSSHVPSVTAFCVVTDTQTKETLSFTKQVGVTQSYPALSVGNIVASDYTVSVGDNVNYSISVSGGSGNYNYKWIKINSQNTMTLSDSSSSSILAKVMLDDCDEFEISCEVTDTVTNEKITMMDLMLVMFGCDGGGFPK